MPRIFDNIDRLPLIFTKRLCDVFDDELNRMRAAHVGHLETVKVLLKGGADVRLKDDMGKTALGYAKEKGHTEVMQVLMKAEKEKK